MASMFRIFRISLGFLLLCSLSLSPVAAARILYFAPHPDDEVISLGGWIYERQAAGDTVAVVVVTDGGRFPRAAIGRKFKPSLFLRQHDFRTLARTRRQESNRALDFLGIPVTQRFFLGYPSGLLTKFLRAPRSEALFRCPALGQRYGVAEWAGRKRPPHPFSQRSIVADIDRLLSTSRPDIVVLPHPRDSNTDHQAVYSLVQKRLQKMDRLPALRMYLVHLGSRRQFPQPYGYHPYLGFEFPGHMPIPKRVPVSVAALRAKEKAIRAHRSQIRLRDGFLLSFIRSEEIFWEEESSRFTPPYP